MMLSKQSKSTKVGLSAHDERARENNCGAAERQAILSNQRGSSQTFSELITVTCSKNEFSGAQRFKLIF